MHLSQFSVPAVYFSLALLAAAAPPVWWGEGSAPAIAAAAPTNHSGPANVAQAKWMVHRALGKLQTIDPVLAAAIHSKLTQPQPKSGGGFYPATINFTAPQPPPFGWTASQRAPLLIGQLKALSAPFYDLLKTKDTAWLSSQLNLNLTKDLSDPANFYPWSSSAADDANLSPATVGQLKSVFSLRFETLAGSHTGGALDTDKDGLTNLAEYNAGSNSWIFDTDGDGLPDKWEMDYFINPLIGTGAGGGLGDKDNDGYSNIREYYLNSNPNSSSSIPLGMVCAGESHTLALTAKGRVWGWGYNQNGVLGDGTPTNRTSPVPLAIQTGMGKIIQIDTGLDFSLALDENGVLWAWGQNGNRQISKDATNQYLIPFKIELSAPVARFVCGGGHVLALDRTGALWSWGANAQGQLGLGHMDPVTGVSPVSKPLGMGNITSLAAFSNSSFAVDILGKIWSWGHNGFGRLGDDSYTNRPTPTAVNSTTGIPAVRSVTAGDYHTMASAVDGSIWTWGGNGNGQLGTGNTTLATKPVKLIAGLTVASFLGAGSNHNLAVSPSGGVWSWGYNGNGQLGINSTTQALSPVQTTTVANWSGIVQVAGGASHSVALKSDGSIWTWGYNEFGQLGLGDWTQRTIPTMLASLMLVNDDVDTDSLPDSWERFYFGNLSQTGPGVFSANGVTNLTAYARSLNPLLLDNDIDGITDTVEIAAGLDPLDWSDATGDLDGDRIPNLWELNMGTSMTDSLSVPGDTLTVDAALVIETITAKKTISAAISAAAGNFATPPYSIIRVQAGVYSENISLPQNKRILLVSAAGDQIPEIRGATDSPTVILYGESVLDGFRLTHAHLVPGQGVWSYLVSPRPQARLVNCLIHGHSAYSQGGGVEKALGRLVIAHCSIFSNTAKYYGNGVYLSGNTQLRLTNSILWNPAGEAAEECQSYGLLTASNSIVRDGSISGTLLLDPVLTPTGLLTSVSSARGRGTATGMAPRDIHGEIRKLTPDIGADEFIDSDNDNLSDAWERNSFGNLVKGGSGDHDLPQGDGLIHLYEYFFGFDPYHPDTLGNGLGDLYNAVFNVNDSPWYPAEWLLDPDFDGLASGPELYYGGNPNIVDTNGDGIEDLLAAFSGISLSSNDTDGDGITNAVEIVNGTNPLLADTDGDGADDDVDPLPTDPDVSSLPAPSPGDTSAPVITLKRPSGAVLSP